MIWRLQESFAAGEISDSAFGLQSTDIVQRGARSLKEAFLTRQGGAKKRPGTKNTNIFDISKMRLIPFVVRFEGFDRNWIVILTPGSYRIYDIDTEQFETLDIPTTPYSLDEIFEVTYTQSRRVLYLFHPKHEPRVLSSGRFDRMLVMDTNGTGPKYAQRVKTSEMSMGEFVEPTLTGEGSQREMTISSPYFVAGDSPGPASLVRSFFQVAGGFVRVDEYKSNQKVVVREHSIRPGQDVSRQWAGPWKSEGDVTTVGVFPATINVGEVGNFVVSTGGTFIEGEDEGKILNPAVSTLNPNFTDYCQIVEVISDTEVRVLAIGCPPLLGQIAPGTRGLNIRKHRLEDRSPRPQLQTLVQPSGRDGTVELRSNLPIFKPEYLGDTTEDAMVFFLNGGSVRLTEFVDEQLVRGEVEVTLGHARSDNFWGRGYNLIDGYPTVGAFHQDRLCIGGVPGFPNQIDFSRTGEHRNFLGGGLASDAIQVNIANDKSDGVTWMKSARDFLVGTTVGEYAVRGTPLTPTSIAVVAQSNYGGLPVRAEAISGRVYFVDRDGHTILATDYREQRDVFTASDVTVQADHIFRATRIRELAYARTPVEMLLAVAEDGTLAAYCFDNDTGVTGWSQWPNLNALSVCVIPLEDRDQIWIAVNRGVSGFTLETIEPDNIEMDYVDEFINPPSNALQVVNKTGTVQVVADGVYLGEFEVENGFVTLPITPSKALVGYSIPFELIPNVLNFEQAGVGNTSGLVKSMNESLLLLRESFGGEVEGAYEATAEGGSLEILMQEQAFDASAERWNGWLHVPGNVSNSRQPTIRISHRTPHSFECLSVNLNLEG